MTYRVGTNSSNSDFILSNVANNSDVRPVVTYWEVPSDGPDQRRVFQYHLIIDITSATKSGGGNNPRYNVSVFSDGIRNR